VMTPRFGASERLGPGPSAVMSPRFGASERLGPGPQPRGVRWSRRGGCRHQDTMGLCQRSPKRGRSGDPWTAATGRADANQKKLTTASFEQNSIF